MRRWRLRQSILLNATQHPWTPASFHTFLSFSLFYAEKGFLHSRRRSPNSTRRNIRHRKKTGTRSRPEPKPLPLSFRKRAQSAITPKHQAALDEHSSQRLVMKG